MEQVVSVAVEQEETQHRFEFQLSCTIADLRAIYLTRFSRPNLSLHLQDSGQLLCDSDVLFDVVDQPTFPSLSPKPRRHLISLEYSSEALVKEFERSPNEFYPPERNMLRIRASKGLTIFVRAAGCIYNFQCDPCDTLGDLRDVCARTFSLNPVQVKLKITSGVVLPLSRDGDSLQDLKDNNVFDAEACEGTMRIFLVLSEFIISYMDLSVNASLAEFRQSVIAHVFGLALVPFRLWSRGVEIVEKEGETVGRQLIGGHPVFVELDSDLEQQLLPKNVTRDRLELCEAPALDMSGSLSL